MNKKKGISLLYVLIIMSFLTVFSISFLFYVRNKESINILEIKYLDNLENRNIKSLLLEKEKEFAKNDSYFTSSLVNNDYERLIYNNNDQSIGGYKIISSTKELPLDKNLKYENMTITYSKKILKETFYYVEVLEFMMDTTGEIQIKLLSKELR